MENKNNKFVKNNNVSHKKDENNEINVRYYIYKCLYNIYVYRAFSNIEIDHIIRENKINEADARLLTNIVYGTISHEKLLRWEMKKLCNKEPKTEATIIILMSLYQFKFLDKVPDFAIIHEAVSIAKKVGNDAIGNFVNAILREAQRQKLEITPELCKDNYEYLSIIYNLPVWVIKMLETHYGHEITQKILEDNTKEAPISLRVNVSKTNIDKILENKDFSKGLLAKNSIIYNGKQYVANLSDVVNGNLSIQDESSQYVVEILDPQNNDKILDMCAAPGSKSAYIAQLIPNGKVLSIDIHEHRVNLMKKMFNSLNLSNTTCVAFDSTKLDTKPKLVESFDKVLLDAPCLGLGVIRRKPDIVLDLSSDKLDEIIALQAKLLDQAYKMVKPGGIIVYSTCSINKKENDSQIMSFIAKHNDMKRIYEKQIFPFEYNSDGFYICKMQKEL